MKRKNKIFEIDGITYKRCPECQLNLPTDIFYKAPRYKYGITLCPKCSVLRNRKYAKQRSEYKKEKRKIDLIWRQKQADICRNWRKNNRDKKREYDRKYNKYKSSADPIYKLKKNLRIAFCDFMGGKRVISVLKLIGCNPEQFKQHLEFQFTSDFTWENHGNKWDLDHIIPLSIFNIKNEEDIALCFNYHNYQPLDSYSNSHIKRQNLFIAKKHLLKKIEKFGMDEIYQKLLNFLETKIIEYRDNPRFCPNYLSSSSG